MKAHWRRSVQRIEIATGSATCRCVVRLYATHKTLNAAARRCPDHDGTKVDGLSWWRMEEREGVPHGIAEVFVVGSKRGTDWPTLVHELHHASRDLAAFLRDSGAFWAVSDDAEHRAEEWAAAFQERAFSEVWRLRPK